MPDGMAKEVEFAQHHTDSDSSGVDAPFETRARHDRLRNHRWRKEWNSYSEYASRYGGGWFD
jgi:hypothetical protein